MFHGRKKTKPVELSDKEKEEKQLKLQKIVAVNKKMLEMRN